MLYLYAVASSKAEEHDRSLNEAMEDLGNEKGGGEIDQ
jgi:hypothetical protein